MDFLPAGDRCWDGAEVQQARPVAELAVAVEERAVEEAVVGIVGMVEAAALDDVKEQMGVLFEKMQKTEVEVFGYDEKAGDVVSDEVTRGEPGHSCDGGWRT